MIREFLCTTEKTKEGIVYMYDEASGTFMGIVFREVKDSDAIGWVLSNIPMTLEDFLKWAAAIKTMVCVELKQTINFDMMWKRHNDASRSSKKKSLVIWNRMKEEDQVKAYHYHPTYMQNKGDAEKKYLETYLRAEMWNN